MRVLVTGGAGNLGREVVSLLASRGDEPIVYDRVAARDTNARACITGEITDRAALETAMREHRIEGVVHLAAILQFGCEEDPVRAVDVNVNGTVAVLQAAKQAGVKRIVHASSIAAYGTTEAELDELSPIQRDVGMYGLTKLLAEALLSREGRRHGIVCRTVIFATVLSDRPVSSPGIAAAVAKIVGSAKGGNVTVDEVAGSERRHFVYFKDAARATVAALVTPQTASDVFHIAGDEGSYITFEELANLIRELRPGAGKVSFTGRSGHRGAVDISRAREQLGYAPAYTLRSALKEILSN
jgi:nucleoside-diphosphate-sugar epimerase